MCLSWPQRKRSCGFCEYHDLRSELLDERQRRIEHQAPSHRGLGEDRGRGRPRLRARPAGAAPGSPDLPTVARRAALTTWPARRSRSRSRSRHLGAGKRRRPRKLRCGTPAATRALSSGGLGHPGGPATRAPDDDLERREEVIADCTEAIRLDPRDPHLYLERAGLRSGLELYEEAIGDSDRAICLDPDLVAAYHGRCHAKSALGLHEEAVEDYDHLVRVDPEAAAALADG